MAACKKNTRKAHFQVATVCELSYVQGSVLISSMRKNKAENPRICPPVIYNKVCI